jgi:hypothetical protein
MLTPQATRGPDFELPVLVGFWRPPPNPGEACVGSRAWTLPAGRRIGGLPVDAIERCTGVQVRSMYCTVLAHLYPKVSLEQNPIRLTRFGGDDR